MPHHAIPSTPGVYAIRNTLSNSLYVGSSSNIRKRCQRHFSELSKVIHANRHLQRAFNKDGISSFSVEILEFVPDTSMLIEREQFFIDTLRPSYNIALIAGRPSDPTGREHSIKTKQKIARAHMGMVPSEEALEAMRKPRSKEGRANIAKGQAARLAKPEEYEKRCQQMKKASEAGSLKAAERREQGIKRVGQPRSLAAREKIRESNNRRWAKARQARTDAIRAANPLPISGLAEPIIPEQCIPLSLWDDEASAS